MGKGINWRMWWPFVLLCLVAWLRLNLQESMPEAASTPVSEAVGCSAGMVLAGLSAVVARTSRPPWRMTALSAAAGALLLCGPEAAMFFGFPSTTGGLVIALALTPVVVAVAIAGERDGSGLTAGTLWPGIAAAAGLLLLITQPSLADIRSDTAWVLAPIATGTGCVVMYRLQGPDATWRAAGALAGAAVVFGAGVLLDARLHVLPNFNVRAAGLDCALAVLSVVSALRLVPLQYAARYAVVPLLVLAEGWVLMRPGLNFRAFCGLAMLISAAMALLRGGKSTEPAEMPSLRM